MPGTRYDASTKAKPSFTVSRIEGLMFLDGALPHGRPACILCFRRRGELAGESTGRYGHL